MKKGVYKNFYKSGLINNYFKFLIDVAYRFLFFHSLFVFFLL